MVTLSKKQAIRFAKQRVLDFLEQDEDVRDVGGFYQYPGEEAYLIDVFLPDAQVLAFFRRIDPVLNDIADNNDFMIGVIPLPPPVSPAK